LQPHCPDYELRQYEPWFDDESSKVLDQRKGAQLQWFLNPSQTNGDNVTKVICKINRISGTKGDNI
jgi:hypothetical protein